MKEARPALLGALPNAKQSIFTRASVESAVSHFTAFVTRLVPRLRVPDVWEIIPPTTPKDPPPPNGPDSERPFAGQGTLIRFASFHSGITDPDQEKFHAFQALSLIHI